jgi:DNA helicase-2/ATP-dependent DNA helicase PcrA
MRVQHATLGEGMVLKSQVQDDDEIVDVFFAGLGLKRLMASMARLEIKQDSH